MSAGAQTVTPGTGYPEESVTTPLTVIFVWAKTGRLRSDRHKTEKRGKAFFRKEDRMNDLRFI